MSGYLESFRNLEDFRSKGWLLVDNVESPIIVILIYYAMVTKFGPHLMRHRKPLSIKPLMMFYNLLQVILCSVFALLYFYKILTRVNLLCMELHTDDPNRDQLMVDLSWYYYMLKYLDLIDTVFYVLTKKQRYVSFLHLFHHISMILMTWVFVKYCPSGAVTVCTFLNCTVHVFMYWYYFCTLYYGKVDVKYKKALTTLQLAQFVLAVLILLIHLVNPYCDYPNLFLLMQIVHGLYFTYLFGNFYYDTYVKHFKVGFGATWRDIIFWPFKNKVHYAFVVATYWSVLYNIYLITYEPSDTYPFDLLNNYVVEPFYVCHTILLILHKLMVVHRCRKIFKPEKLLILAFDVISLFPINMVFKLINRFTWNLKFHHRHTTYTSCYFKMLRIVRMLRFLQILDTNQEDNQMLVIFVVYIGLSFFLIISAASWLYYQACFKCDIPNWTNFLEYFDFNPKSDRYWFVVSTTYISALFFHNTTLTFEWTNAPTFWNVIITLVLGYVLHRIFLSGVLLAQEIQSTKMLHLFQSRLDYCLKLMRTLNVPKHYQSIVSKYYNTVWDCRLGVVDLPDTFKLLPPSLQIEIVTDMYWEALLHSKIFGPVPNNFKRELALVMKTEICTPGHFIYTIDSVKAKMVYISSGVVEVFTSDRSTQSSITFSHGTILGEISSLQAMICTSDVRCLTKCILHVLHLTDLYRILLRYPKVYKLLRKQKWRRIKYAIKKKSMFRSMGISHMTWMKQQWKHVQKNKDATFHPLYSSKFLDLITIAPPEESQQNICLREKCPFLIRENTGFYKFLVYLCLTSVLLQIIFTFHSIVFMGRIYYGHYGFLCVLDLIYVLDIYLQISTSLYVHNILVTEPYEVFLQRTKNFAFFVDVVATIPLDYVAILTNAKNFYVALFRLPRFLKVYKIFILFSKFERNITGGSIYFKLLKFLCYHQIFTIFLSCIVYFLNCFDGVCFESSWLAMRRQEDEALHLSDFFICYYYTLSTYLQLDLSSTKLYNVSSLLMNFVLIIFGFFINAIEFTQFCAAFGLSFEIKHKFMEYTQFVETYVKEHKKLKSIKGKIMDYVEIQYSIGGEVRYPDIANVMLQHSEFIRRNVTDDYVVSIFKKSKFYQGLPKSLLRTLANRTSFHVVPPGHILLRANIRCYYLYTIVAGYCVVRSKTPGDFEKQSKKFLSKYETWPVIEFLHGVDSLIEVSTHTAVQILSLPLLDFKSAMGAFTDESRKFDRAIQKHTALYRGLLNRKTFTPFIKKPVLCTQEKVKVFTYKQRAGRNPGTVRHTSNASFYKKYRNLMVNLHFSTYDSASKTYFVYESFRVICTLLQMFSTYGMVMSKYFYSSYRYIFDNIFICLWIADMFIRMHLQYYNDLGIRVTKVGCTFKEYLKTAFAIDFISGFPLDLLKIEMFFHPNYRHVAHMLVVLHIRSLMLYRPWTYFNLVQKMSSIKAMISIKKIVVCFWLILSTVHLSIIKLILTCMYDRDREFVCPPDSWMAKAPHFRQWKKNYYFFINFCYTVFTTITLHHTNYNLVDHILTMILALLVRYFRLLCYATVIGDNSIRNSRLTTHLGNLRRYEKYMKSRLVSNSTKEELKEHFTNIWKKANSEKSIGLFDDFYPYLREVILLKMYYPSLSKCLLFQGVNKALFRFRLIVPYIQERHYKKGAHIIRINDVQKEVFIVHKGMVEISVADSKLHTLGIGGMFGCFDKSGSVRHNLHVQATQHVSLMCMATSDFYRVVRDFSLVEQRLKEVRRFQFQFVFAKTQGASSFATLLSSVMSSDYEVQPEATMVRFMVFRFYEYFTCVHVATLSSMVALIAFAFPNNIWLLIFWIFTDLYFYIGLYFRVHKPIEDLETGDKITQLTEIRKRYFRSVMFIMDIVTMLPLYAIQVIWYHQMVNNWFVANKLLRIYYFVHYYNTFVQRRNVPVHLHWTLLTYAHILVFQIIFSITWFLDPEYIFRKPFYVEYNPINFATDYLILINVITCSGLRINESKFADMYNLGELTTVATLASFVAIYMTEIFIKMFLNQTHYKCSYKQGISSFKKFCKGEGVSEALVQRCCLYLTELYDRQEGEQFPVVLKYTPLYLKVDHMYSLYAKHFGEHSIFKDIHMDLLKQILVHAKCYYYPPNAVIVERGQKNGTIYYIEQGNVVAINKSQVDSAEVQYEVLGAGKGFGENQGFMNVEHNRTYKTLSPTDIVSIKMQDWQYLLDHFPASRDKVFRRVQDNIIYFSKTY